MIVSSLLPGRGVFKHAYMPLSSAAFPQAFRLLHQALREKRPGRRRSARRCLIAPRVPGQPPPLTARRSAHDVTGGEGHEAVHGAFEEGAGSAPRSQDSCLLDKVERFGPDSDAYKAGSKLAVTIGEALAGVRSLSSRSEAESVWGGFGAARAEVVAAVHKEIRPPLRASAWAAERRRTGGSCALSGGSYPRVEVTPSSDRVTADRERLKGGPVKLGVNGPSFLRTWLGLATVAFL
jgi:hypothetical protein